MSWKEERGTLLSQKEQVKAHKEHLKYKHLVCHFFKMTNSRLYFH